MDSSAIRPIGFLEKSKRDLPEKLLRSNSGYVIGRLLIKGYGLFSLRLIGFDATFLPFTFSTVILGTLKDNSPLMNSLASNNCFSNRKVFQNGVNTLYKRLTIFVKKLKILYILDLTILFKFHQNVVQILIK